MYVHMFGLPVSPSNNDVNRQGLSSSHRAVRSPQRLLGEKSMYGQCFGLAEQFQFPSWLPIHFQWEFNDFSKFRHHEIKLKMKEEFLSLGFVKKGRLECIFLFKLLMGSYMNAHTYCTIFVPTLVL